MSKQFWAVLTAFIISTWGVVCPELWAQAESSGSLDAIVVTSSRSAESKREVTTNITVIDDKTIELAPTKNLGELLGQQGFQIRSYGVDNLTNLGIRGFRTESHGVDLLGHVLVLFNGRRTGNGNLAKMSTLNLDRIEIIRGPAAVQYGPAAMGGVVNLITKRGEGPFAGRIEAGIGSFGRVDSGLTFSGAQGPFDYSFGYQFMTLDNYNTAHGEKYNNTFLHQRHTGDVDLGYTFLDNHRLGINVSFYDIGHSGGANSISSNPPSTADLRKSNYSVDFNYEGHTADKRFSWSARYSFGNDKDEWDYPTGFYFNDIDSRNIQAQLTWNEELFQLTGGVDYLKYEHDHESIPLTQHYLNLGIFLIGKIRLLDDKLILSASAREDWYKVEIKSGDGSQAKDKNFSPSIGIAYSPLDWLKLRANYSEAFIVPTGNQLAADFYSQDYYSKEWIHYLGNPNLKPESSRAFEFGFDIGWNELDVSLTYFTNKVKNIIVSNPIDSTTTSYKNLDKANLSGIEFSAGFDIGHYLEQSYSLRPYISLTHMTQRKDSTTGATLQSVPKTLIAYGLSFDHPQWDFSANLNAKYFGQEVAYNYSLGKEVSGGKFTVVDLSLRKKLFDLPYGKLDLKVQINNLLNEYYEYVLGYPSPGRAFYVGLAYVF
ncbi:MAG: TonB-dependent receptor [Deltaproteobacteria bacterium]|nr:TonB-dependent receptor [Deltaproteobacteria bacterium]